MLVGITGNIGSGKSTLSQILKLKGFKVLNADEIGKEVLQKEAFEEVVKAFGKGVLKGKNIDIKKLAKIVFEDKKKLDMLTSITHPLIKERIKREKERSLGALTFIEAAVLIEYGWQELFDRIVLVFAYKGQRLLRASRRFGLKEAIRRDSLQLPYSKKLCYSDFLICNTSTLLKLKEQAEWLLKELKVESGSNR